MEPQDEQFLRRAIALATASRAAGGDPFGTVLVIGGQVVYEAGDRCVELSDPTAHSELQVMSAYCRAAHRFALVDATLYCSTEPCAMCAGAMHWVRLGRLVYSVPQELLQAQSGGRPKQGCAEIINSGHHITEIVGPLLVEEGRTALAGYTFGSKRIRHAARFGASS